jgi:hypothetical protein
LRCWNISAAAIEPDSKKVSHTSGYKGFSPAFEERSAFLFIINTEFHNLFFLMLQCGRIQICIMQTSPLYLSYVSWGTLQFQSLTEVKYMELHGIVTLPVIPLRGCYCRTAGRDYALRYIGRKKTLSAMEQALSEEGSLCSLHRKTPR